MVYGRVFSLHLIVTSVKSVLHWGPRVAKKDACNYPCITHCTHIHTCSISQFSLSRSAGHFTTAYQIKLFPFACDRPVNIWTSVT